MKSPAVDIAGHLIRTDPAIQVDEQGRLVGLPDAIINQIADRVIEKLRIQQRLDDLSLL
jgi:hypothetical protein